MSVDRRDEVYVDDALAIDVDSTAGATANGSSSSHSSSSSSSSTSHSSSTHLGDSTAAAAAHSPTAADGVNSAPAAATTAAMRRSPSPSSSSSSRSSRHRANVNSPESLRADTWCAKCGAATSIVAFVLLWFLFVSIFGGRGYLMPVIYAPVAAYAWWIRSKRLKHEALGQTHMLPTNTQLLLLIAGGFFLGSVCTIILETVILSAFSIMFGGILKMVTPVVQLLLMFFILSYPVAAFVEEHMKYVFAHSHKWRPMFTASIDGVLLYSMAAALGFSIAENIMYVYGPSIIPDAANTGTDAAAAASVHFETDVTGPFLLQLLTRVCIATPLHVTTAYFIGLGIARRDVLGEPLARMKIMLLPMVLHGTFNFHQFILGVIIFTPDELRAQLGFRSDAPPTAPRGEDQAAFTTKEITFQVLTLLTTSIILVGSIWYARKRRRALDGGGYQVVDDESAGDMGVEMQSV